MRVNCPAARISFDTSSSDGRTNGFDSVSRDNGNVGQNCPIIVEPELASVIAPEEARILVRMDLFGGSERELECGLREPEYPARSRTAPTTQSGQTLLTRCVRPSADAEEYKRMERPNSTPARQLAR